MIPKPGVILVLFFCAYVFVGMLFTYYPGEPSYNLFLGADNERVFGDLALIGYDHYRIKVHPLFVLLVQPVVLFLTGITHNPLLSIVLIESLCGSAMVALLFCILKKMDVRKSVRICITLIYGFSFSNLLFSSIPETFIFTGVAMLGYLYYLSYLLEKQSLSTQDILFLSGFGIVLFGITITNYFFFLIGLFFLCRGKVKKGSRMAFFFKVVTISFLLVVILCVVQQIIWPRCPLFWDSLFVAATDLEQYEEVRYIGFAFSPSTFAIWFKQFFIYPLIGVAPQQTISLENNLIIEFGAMSIFDKCFALLFYLTFAFSLFSVFAKKIRSSCFKTPSKESSSKTTLISIVLVGFIFNFVLHLFYSPMEAFLYSPHYLFLGLILFAVAINWAGSRAISKWLLVPIIACLCLEIGVNIGSITDIADLLVFITGLDHSMFKALLFSLVVAAALFLTMVVGFSSSVSNKNLRSVLIIVYCGIVVSESFFIYIG